MTARYGRFTFEEKRGETVSMNISITGLTEIALRENIGRITRSPLFREVNVTNDTGGTKRLEMDISSMYVANYEPSVFVTDNYIKIESAIDDFYIVVNRYDYYSIEIL